MAFVANQYARLETILDRFVQLVNLRNSQTKHASKIILALVLVAMALLFRGKSYEEDKQKRRWINITPVVRLDCSQKPT